MIATLPNTGSLLNSGSCRILVALQYVCVAAKNSFFFSFFSFLFFSFFFSLVKHKSALDSWITCGTWQVFRGLKSHATPRKWNGVKHYSSPICVTLLLQCFRIWVKLTCCCTQHISSDHICTCAIKSWIQPNSSFIKYQSTVEPRK